MTTRWHYFSGMDSISETVRFEPACRIVSVRCAWKVIGTAPSSPYADFSITRRASTAGLPVVMRTVSSVGPGRDVSIAWDDDDRSAFILNSEILSFEWSNPSPGNIRWEMIVVIGMTGDESIRHDA